MKGFQFIIWFLASNIFITMMAQAKLDHHTGQTWMMGISAVYCLWKFFKI